MALIGLTAFSAPCRISAAACRQFDLLATFDGGTFDGDVTAELDPATLTGPYTLTGNSHGGGLTVPQTGTGTMMFIADGQLGGPRCRFTSFGFARGREWSLSPERPP